MSNRKYFSQEESGDLGEPAMQLINPYFSNIYIISGRLKCILQNTSITDGIILRESTHYSGLTCHKGI